MINYVIPPEDNQRIVAQLIADTTGKTCQFRVLRDLEDCEYMPLVGWAVVIWAKPGEHPEVTLEPVVDDRCHGPIPLGELEREVGELELVDIS